MCDSDFQTEYYRKRCFMSVYSIAERFRFKFKKRKRHISGKKRKENQTNDNRSQKSQLAKIRVFAMFALFLKISLPLESKCQYRNFWKSVRVYIKINFNFYKGFSTFDRKDLLFMFSFIIIILFIGDFLKTEDKDFLDFRIKYFWFTHTKY